MADRNKYGRREYGDDNERSYGRDRQPEQFQSGRSGYSNDYDDSYGQMGDDSSSGQNDYSNQYGDSSRDRGYGYDRQGSDRSSGSSWRQDENSRSDRYGSSSRGGYAGSNFSNRERGGGFGSFNAGSYGRAGDIGPRDDTSGFGRGDTFRGAGYGGGSFGGGGYGVAPRRDYGQGSSYGSSDRGFFERAGDEVASWFGDDEAARRREMDHRGRGPSNYKRSDERVLEDTCDRLTEDRGVDASNIQVTVQNGEVTLDGTVENRSQKRRAEDCVHEVSGVGHVQNNLRTSDSTRSDSNDSTTDRTSATDRNAGTLA